MAVRACNPNHVRFFDPRLYETVVLLDQRGCGRSIPVGEVGYNTLELLVDDIERLRRIILSSSSSSSSSDNDDLNQSQQEVQVQDHGIQYWVE